MAEICHFFEKNSFLEGAWGLYHRIIQKLLELELSLKISYSGTFLATNIFASYRSSLSVIVSEIWQIFGMPKMSKN